eukprot:CAMPEP_0202467712 /NCGR_PEP_ID=MMETSP1360-20130828/73081_1 /ASSEMBLY_ACC=CAM_ASM_000848 /TAXON_ID=515479 /ORGANISM="Licmophora paradoxa, Strain CCMP2313" /LENGTH=51 /DNA_ID=CAMNT_0049092379 /DNA_START=88 /DNA_END=243 /DNA_ORIENTATION=-
MDHNSRSHRHTHLKKENRIIQGMKSMYELCSIQNVNRKPSSIEGILYMKGM